MQKKQTSLKTKLLQYLRRRRDWVNSGVLEHEVETMGYKPSNGSRRLRELVNETLIHRRLEKAKTRSVKIVYYKAV